MDVLVASAAAAKSLQLCPILCNPIDGSPPGSAIPGILQARALQWGAIACSTSRLVWMVLQWTRECKSLFETLFSFGWIPGSGVAASYGSFIFNFLWNLHAVFHSSGTILHSHQQCIMVSISPHPCWHFYFFDNRYPDRYEVVSHYGSDLHFSDA